MVWHRSQTHFCRMSTSRPPQTGHVGKTSHCASFGDGASGARGEFKGGESFTVAITHPGDNVRSSPSVTTLAIGDDYRTDHMEAINSEWPRHAAVFLLWM